MGVRDGGPELGATVAICAPRHAVVWLPALVGIALIKLAASAGGLVVGIWSGRALGWVFFADVSVFAAAGLYLLIGGRADRRAVWLGCLFLLISTAFADTLLAGYTHGTATRSRFATALLRVQPAAFAPYFFWLFVREFPRPRPQWRLGSLADAASRLALGVGVFLALANFALLSPVAASMLDGPARLLARTTPEGAFWPVLFLAGLPALPYAILQARRAAPDERRRVTLLLSGLAFGVSPPVAVSLAAAVWPTFGRFAWSSQGTVAVGLVAHPALLAIPVITAYAVLAHRALDVRLIVRKALQYVLARSTVLTAMLLPFAAALALLYLRREESVQEVLSGTTGLLLAAILLTGVAAWHLRLRLLVALDRRFYREQYDAQRILSGLVGRGGSLRDPAEVATVVAVEIDRALHLDGVEMLLLDTEHAAFASPLGGARPLPLSSRLARELGSAAGPVAVDWSHPDPWLARLDSDDRGWLMEMGTHLVVPIPGADGWPTGALLLGEKRSELPFSREDRQLLQAVAVSAGLALQQQRGAGAHAADAVAARECPDCGLVADAAATACARCGARMVAAAVPVLIAGKLRPLERIGHGGMGVVYRALDLTLDRAVAVKTLPRLSPVAASLLRREARAMAAVSDPNLGTIHGVETWNGAPLLVVELLGGGTLADRLTRGPLTLSQVLETGRALAGGLGRLHAAGILHRDVKPSNIGFAIDGTPKLVDFGVARMVSPVEGGTPIAGRLAPDEPATTDLRTRTGELVGTPAYLSPEAARGEPPDPRVDLWALCMVMYEALAGAHPFQGVAPYLLLHRIATADVPDPRGRIPGLPEAVAVFLSEALHRDARRRPRTASELCQRLTQLSVSEEALDRDRKEVLR